MRKKIVERFLALYLVLEFLSVSFYAFAYLIHIFLYDKRFKAAENLFVQTSIRNHMDVLSAKVSHNKFASGYDIIAYNHAA